MNVRKKVRGKVWKAKGKKVSRKPRKGTFLCKEGYAVVDKAGKITHRGWEIAVYNEERTAHEFCEKPDQIVSVEVRVR